MTFPIFSLWCLTPYSTMFHRWVSENGLRPNLCLGFSSGNSGMDHESNDVKFMVKLKVLVSLCPRAPVSPLRRLARGRQCNWQICSKKRRSWELRGTLVITWNHMGGFPKIWVPLGTPKSSINYYFMFFSKDNPFFGCPHVWKPSYSTWTENKGFCTDSIQGYILVLWCHSWPIVWRVVL